MVDGCWSWAPTDLLFFHPFLWPFLGATKFKSVWTGGDQLNIGLAATWCFLSLKSNGSIMECSYLKCSWSCDKTLNAYTWHLWQIQSKLEERKGFYRGSKEGRVSKVQWVRASLTTSYKEMHNRSKTSHSPDFIKNLWISNEFALKRLLITNL